MTENENKLNFVENMIHVVCLPFKIRRQNGGREERLSDIAKFIEDKGKGVWTPGRHCEISEASKIQKYQAQAYFHPFVRRFLFDQTGNELIRFHRTDVKSVHISLSGYDEAKGELNLVINKCELALFQPDIGLLILETQFQKDAQKSLGIAQDLMDQFRRIYPPFFDFNKADDPSKSKSKSKWKGGHCPVSVTIGGSEDSVGKYQFESEQPVLTPELEDNFLNYMNAECIDGTQHNHYPMALHWQFLLSPFDCTTKSKNAEYKIEQLGDDRAPVMSWIAVTEPRNISDGDWVRLCFADEKGTNIYPYAKKFLSNFEDKYCYDRYWYKGSAVDSYSNPSRILNCGYAFSFVGKNDAKEKFPFFSNAENGAVATFRNLYVEMGLIAHFQKAALLSYSEKLSELVSRKDGEIKLPDKEKVTLFYDHFVEFTQNFWFDEISPQEQGREMFEMYRKHLRLQELYDEVRQELKDLVDYTEMQLSSKEMKAASILNEVVMWFGGIGLVIAYLSFLAGVGGMNDIKEGSQLIEKYCSIFLLCLQFPLLIVAIPVLWWKTSKLKGRK